MRDGKVGERAFKRWFEKRYPYYRLVKNVEGLPDYSAIPLNRYKGMYKTTGFFIEVKDRAAKLPLKSHFSKQQLYDLNNCRNALAAFRGKDMTWRLWKLDGGKFIWHEELFL